MQLIQLKRTNTASTDFNCDLAHLASRLFEYDSAQRDLPLFQMWLALTRPSAIGQNARLFKPLLHLFSLSHYCTSFPPSPCVGTLPWLEKFKESKPLTFTGEDLNPWLLEAWIGAIVDFSTLGQDKVSFAVQCLSIEGSL